MAKYFKTEEGYKEIGTPDWNVDDENELGYIKNRTHYDARRLKWLIGSNEAPGNIGLETITLPWNESEEYCQYTIKDVSLSDYEVYIQLYDDGELVLADNVQIIVYDSYYPWDPYEGAAYPGVTDIGYKNGNLILYYWPAGKELYVGWYKQRASLTSMTLSLAVNTGELVTLEEKYIPKTIARTSYVQSVESSALKKTSQTLTEYEKTQVRQNIGAASSSEIVQADWKQNDKTALDYVKNRTHYVEIQEKGMTSIVENKEISFTSKSYFYHGFVQDNSSAFTNSSYAIVTWNNDEYICPIVMKEDDITSSRPYYKICIGSQDDYTKEPFYIEGSLESSVTFIHKETSDEETVSFGIRVGKTAPSMIVHQLNEKYIPDIIARSENYIGKTNTIEYTPTENYHPATKKYVDDILQKIYPIGAIYLSMNSTSPASIFGGTWEQIEDRFLLGAGTNYAANTSGGSAEHTHNTALRFASYWSAIAMEGLEKVGMVSYSTDGTKTPIPSTRIGYTGEDNSNFINAGNQPSKTAVGSFGVYETEGNTSYTSNMPPYLAVYMWKRIE